MTPQGTGAMGQKLDADEAAFLGMIRGDRWIRIDLLMFGWEC